MAQQSRRWWGEVVLLLVLLGGEGLASRPSHASPARWNQFPLTTGSSWEMNGVTDIRL